MFFVFRFSFFGFRFSFFIDLSFFLFHRGVLQCFLFRRETRVRAARCYNLLFLLFPPAQAGCVQHADFRCVQRGTRQLFFFFSYATWAASVVRCVRREVRAALRHCFFCFPARDAGYVRRAVFAFAFFSRATRGASAFFFWSNATRGAPVFAFFA